MISPLNPSKPTPPIVGATAQPNIEELNNNLCTAARNNDKNAILQLLQGGAEINAKDKKFGTTPLSWAAHNGHTEVAKLLIENGAEVDVRRNDGQTPLSLVVYKGHAEVAKLLRQHGAQ